MKPLISGGGWRINPGLRLPGVLLFTVACSPWSFAQQSHESAVSVSTQTEHSLAPLESASLQALRRPAVSLTKRYGVVPYSDASSADALQIDAITPACNSPQLSYFNGPVMSNVQVVPVLWSSNVNAQISANISQFYADATVSNWYDMLSEYASVGGTNQSIGRGTSVAAITLVPSRCGSTTTCTISDAQLQAELNSQIQNGVLPSPQQDSTGNTNTLYMVHFPPNVRLNGPGGAGTSCSSGGFCAYHNTGTFGSGSLALPYGAVMDSLTGACSTGCGGNATAFENLTSTASHELTEAVTDADIGLDIQAQYAFPAGWGDNNNQCGEVADICDTGVPGSTITVNGRSWIVQQLWSNALNACVGTGLKPNFVITAPAAATAGASFAFTVTAKNPSGNLGTDTAYVGTVHFTSSDPGAVLPADSIYSVAAQGTASFNATLNGAGSRTITATDMLNGAIVGTSGAINVTPRSSQTITFANPGAQVYGSTLMLSATASSTLPVSFTSATTSICTVTSAGVLTLVKVGSCTIDADQSGNSVWLPAAQVAQTFQVTKASTAATLSSPCRQTFVEHQPFTMIAAVNAVNATGNVVFSDGNGATLCSVALASGTATCTTSALAASGTATDSSYSLSADYSGDLNYQSSSSGALVVDVLSAASVVFRNNFELNAPSCPAE
jgi:Bacterial Ig-like domain (group 3)